MYWLTGLFCYWVICVNKAHSGEAIQYGYAIEILIVVIMTASMVARIAFDILLVKCSVFVNESIAMFKNPKYWTRRNNGQVGTALVSTGSVVLTSIASAFYSLNPAKDYLILILLIAYNVLPVADMFLSQSGMINNYTEE